MRIFLLGVVTIIGANVFIAVMNSKTVDLIQERNAALERLLNPPSSSIE
tara:strand:+ start:57 stop:203 length:147 start_codon:yes stop_codon:yes gene_type:complete